MIENTERQADRSAPLPDWSACLEFGPKVQQNIEVLGGRAGGRAGGRPLYHDDALQGSGLWQGSLCGSLKMQP